MFYNCSWFHLSQAVANTDFDCYLLSNNVGMLISLICHFRLISTTFCLYLAADFQSRFKRAKHLGQLHSVVSLDAYTKQSRGHQIRNSWFDTHNISHHNRGETDTAAPTNQPAAPNSGREDVFRRLEEEDRAMFCIKLGLLLALSLNAFQCFVVSH